MRTTMLTRRTIIAAAAGLPWLGAHAQVTDLGDAINKAGRQRMLSQRMGKAWLALVHGVEKSAAQQALDKSMALFDRQQVELKSYASSPELRDTYIKLDALWNTYKTDLVGSAPSKSNATVMLQHNSQVLALAQHGTVQYEAISVKPVGKLVNIAGRQRMLSQRMAMYYLAAKLPVDVVQASAEIEKARTEFVQNMAVLRNAPETTARIKDELQQADGQWVFFDSAFQKFGSNTGHSTRPLGDVFVASENLLTVMDQITGMYSSLKT